MLEPHYSRQSIHENVLVSILKQLCALQAREPEEPELIWGSNFIKHK